MEREVAPIHRGPPDAGIFIDGVAYLRGQEEERECLFGTKRYRKPLIVQSLLTTKHMGIGIVSHTLLSGSAVISETSETGSGWACEVELVRKNISKYLCSLTC